MYDNFVNKLNTEEQTHEKFWEIMNFEWVFQHDPILYLCFDNTKE